MCVQRLIFDALIRVPGVLVPQTLKQMEIRLSAKTTFYVNYSKVALFDANICRNRMIKSCYLTELIETEHT